VKLDKTNWNEWAKFIVAFSDDRLQVLRDEGWVDISEIDFDIDISKYREKPKERDFWIAYEPSTNGAFHDPTINIKPVEPADPKRKVIHVREVLS